MDLSYYNKFDELINTINLRLYCLLLTPLLFIGNGVSTILVVIIISVISILNDKTLPRFDDIYKELDVKLDEEEVQSSDEEESQASDEEEKEEAQASDEEEKEEAQASEDDEDSDCNCNDDQPELIDLNKYLVILSIPETKQKYITNNFIKNTSSKKTHLGNIKLNDLILLEVDISEQDIEQIKIDNEVYDYANFDNKLDELEDIHLECAWRRYKHILKENEYKDNTYTIL